MACAADGDADGVWGAAAAAAALVWPSAPCLAAVELGGVGKKQNTSGMLKHASGISATLTSADHATHPGAGSAADCDLGGVLRHCKATRGEYLCSLNPAPV